MSHPNAARRELKNAARKAKNGEFEKKATSDSKRAQMKLPNWGATLVAPQPCAGNRGGDGARGRRGLGRRL